MGTDPDFHQRRASENRRCGNRGLSLVFAAFFLATAAACAQPAGNLRFEVSSVRVGRQPGHVVVADVDGDRRLDLVTANGGDRTVTVLLGDGRGRFSRASGSPFAVPMAPHFVAAGDCTGDGRPDLVLTDHDSNDAFFFRGEGRGRFAAPTRRPLIAGVQPHNHGLVLADVDGDAILDVLSSNNDGNSASVLLGDGRGGFRPSRGSPFSVGRAPYPLTVADFNGDRKPDVATPDVNGHTVSVLIGDGTGAMAPAPGSPYRVAERPFFVVAIRANGDSAPDLVVSHDDADELTVLVNDGRGRFTPAGRVNVGGRTWKLASEDFDRDGHADVVAGVAPSTVVVLLGDGKAGFRVGGRVAVGRGPWSLAVGDLDGDGKTDVVTANGDDETASILLAR